MFAVLRQEERHDACHGDGYAAAPSPREWTHDRTPVAVLRQERRVMMPAFEMEMLCCSIAFWMNTPTYSNRYHLKWYNHT
jgi:hypothetical protein